MSPMPLNRSKIIFTVGLLSTAILVSACQTTPVTPDSAQRNIRDIETSIALSYESGKFTPPPRKSDDIIRLLYKSKSPLKTKYVKRRADENPPILDNESEVSQDSDESPDTAISFDETLYRFYVSRGEAAGIMGRIGQKIADYELALKHLLKYLGTERKSVSLTELLFRLGWSYEGFGEFEKAGKTFLKALEAVPSSRSTSAAWSHELYRYSAYAYFAGWMGNYSESELYIQKAKHAWSIHEGQTYRELRWLKSEEGLILKTEGRLAQSRGEYKKAEQLFIKAITLAEEYDRLDDIAFYRRHLSEVLYFQGKMAEAEAHARKALGEILEYGGSSYPSTAYFIYNLGLVLISTGRTEEAISLAEAALKIFSEAAPLDDRTLPVISLRYILMTSAIMEDRWPAAIEQANIINKHFGSIDSPLLRAEPGAALFLVLLSFKEKKYEEALAKADKTLVNFTKKIGPNHLHTLMTVGIQATILEDMGRDNEALIKFLAIRHILTGTGSKLNLAGFENRAEAKGWRMISESYLRLLQRIDQDQLGKISRIEESFLVAQALSGSATDKALAASSARSIGKNTNLGRLIRTLQDLQVKREAVLKAISYNFSLPIDERNNYLIASLQAFVVEREQEIVSTQQQISNKFPKYKNVVAPSSLNFSKLRRVLRAGEALIATHVAKDQTYIWAIPFEGDVAFTIANIGEEALTSRVNTLRLALDTDAETLGKIPEFDVVASYKIFEQLLEPVKNGWKNAKRLLVVADGPLSYLPFSVLTTNDVELPSNNGLLFSNYRDIPWLVRSHAITNLPSVTSLNTLRGSAVRTMAQKPFVGFGDPLFSKEQATEAVADDLKKNITVASHSLKSRGIPIKLRAPSKTKNLESANLSSLPRIPDTADEIRSIAATLGANPAEDIFLRKKASEIIVKNTDLSDYRVLAFATHGLIPGDLNGLTQPALAFSDPSFTDDKINDGLLTMGEVLTLKLNADWVVLSACNTASGEGEGAKAISGLGRAFFFAGTRAILVSNWPVETTSARALTTALFKEQVQNPNLSRTDALRRSMLELIDRAGYLDSKSKVPYFSYAHPLFWAPFTIVGEGGELTPQG